VERWEGLLLDWAEARAGRTVDGIAFEVTFSV
jgi:hypothetical protein